MENNETFTFDSVIEDEGRPFILLPEGDYDFVVTNFERGNFPGSAKIPPCLKATITLEITTDEGKTSIRTDLMFAKIVEWKMCSFFRSIGQKKSGQPLKPNWNTVVGSYGKAHIKQREYINKQGEKKIINDVDNFLDAPIDEITDDDLPFKGELSHLKSKA